MTLSPAQLVQGADWPAWQRDLGPFTYMTDRAAIRRMMDEVERELGISRRSLSWAMKQYANDYSYRHVMRGHRRQIERFTKLLRNGETRLRLLADARLRLVVDNERAA